MGAKALCSLPQLLILGDQSMSRYKLTVGLFVIASV